MKKKLLTLLTLLLCAVGGANAEEELTPSSSTEGAGTNNADVVMTSYTIPGTCNPGGGSKNGSWGNRWMKKIRTNQTVTIAGESKSNCFYINVNSGYVITGVSLYLTTNKSTEANTLIATYYDDTTKDASLSTNIASQGAASPTQVSISGISATSRVVLQFSDSKQVLVYGTIYYKENTVATSETLKTSDAVKIGETTLTLGAATNGYSIDGTSIAITDDVTALSTPSNIALVKTITYDDASTKDEDVDVTFDGTITDGYYIGTATIGLSGSETDYTVRIKQNVAPTANLSSTSGSISIANSYTVVGSTTVTLTGGNLVDGTYNVVADVAGTTISPASFTVTDGSVSQEFTITSSASSAATTVFTFGTSSMGVAAPIFTVTYSKVAQRILTQTDVTEATTWDWTKSGGASIELTALTSPGNGEEFLLAALPEITNDGTFNSQALKVSCQWPNRGSNYYFQGNSVKFNVTMPGTVQVWFSNTSNRDDNATNRRYLYVNGTNSGVYTLNQTFTNTEAMSVPAGEVVINAFTGEENATMIRINKIVFTPTPEPADPTVSGEETYLTTSANMAGWRAFYDASNDYSVDANTTVYVAEQNPVGDKITLTSIDGIPAGVAVVLKTVSSADSYKMTLTKETAGTYTYSGTNKLEYTTSTVDQKYRLGYGASGVGFYPYSGTPASGAVILNVSSASARALTFAFDDETTGIKSFTPALSEGEGVVFDMQGRRVMVPQKGLYIVNGKKVVIK